MKKFLLKIVIAVSIMAIPVISQAQGSDISKEADHELLRGLRTKIASALNSRDVTRLINCFTDNFVLTTVDQTTITTKEQLKEYFIKTFDDPDSIITEMKFEPNADVLTQFIDQNTGFCYGNSIDTYKMRKGPVVVMNSRWTAVLVKQNGEWRIAAAHAGTNFLDNPVITKVISKGHFQAGMCLVIGLILGFLGAKIFGRQKIKQS